MRLNSSMCSFQRTPATPAIRSLTFWSGLLVLRSSDLCPLSCDLLFLGGHKAVVRPVPIPNTAVKHSLADGSSSIGSARVGCRQFCLKSRNEIVSAFFILLSSRMMLNFNLKLNDENSHDARISKGRGRYSPPCCQGRAIPSVPSWPSCGTPGADRDQQSR